MPIIKDFLSNALTNTVEISSGPVAAFFGVEWAAGISTALEFFDPGDPGYEDGGVAFNSTSYAAFSSPLSGFGVSRTSASFFEKPGETDGLKTASVDLFGLNYGDVLGSGVIFQSARETTLELDDFFFEQTASGGGQSAVLGLDLVPGFTYDDTLFDGMLPDISFM